MQNNVYTDEKGNIIWSFPDDNSSEKKVGYPYNFMETKIVADYTLSDNAFSILIDASSNDIDVTIPDILTLTGRAKQFILRRVDDSSYRVRIKLADTSQSLFGSDYGAMLLEQQGDGIIVNVHSIINKYSFAWFEGKAIDLPVPEVTTDQVSETSGTLDMNGTLVSLAAYDSMDCYFQYKDITAGDTNWTETTPTNLTTPGTFSDSISVTSGHKIQIRAVAKEPSTGATVYGAIKQVNGPLYMDIQSAKADGLVWYVPLQETTGTNTQGQEVIEGNDMDFFGSTTIASDVVNGNTVYKRVFDDNTDYGESSYQPTVSSGDWTIGCQLEMRASSGDHSIWHFGTNTLSRAADAGRFQLSVNGSINNSSTLIPTGSQKIYHIVVDNVANQTTHYEDTSTNTTSLGSISAIPNNDGTFIRLGRGASGDSNQQDTEYLYDGDVRCMYIYSRKLDDNERQAIAKCLENGFPLIEGI